MDMLSFLADRDCQPCMSRVYRGRFPALIQSRERFCEDWILFCESPPQTRLSRGAALFRVHPSPRCSATFCARLFMVMHCLSGARIERAATKTSWSLSLLSPVLFARASGRTETFFAFVASAFRSVFTAARCAAWISVDFSNPAFASANCSRVADPPKPEHSTTRTGSTSVRFASSVSSHAAKPSEDINRLRSSIRSAWVVPPVWIVCTAYSGTCPARYAPTSKGERLASGGGGGTLRLVTPPPSRACPGSPPMLASCRAWLRGAGFDCRPCRWRP